jgi:hypothetical protein
VVVFWLFLLICLIGNARRSNIPKLTQGLFLNFVNNCEQVPSALSRKRLAMVNNSILQLSLASANWAAMPQNASANKEMVRE